VYLRARYLPEAMATIRPFRGLRFDATAGPLSELVAPPYDVLSPDEREAYAAKSPRNIVHLTLPEQLPGDRSQFVKYARSAARLEEWRRDGSLKLDDRPAFYRYTQSFKTPGSDAPFERTTLIVLLKVEPYDKGVVLPHEQTFPKHKEDRLRVLEATRSHLECIFGLYEDDDRTIHGLVTGAPGEPAAPPFTTQEDGIAHRLDAIADPDAVKPIVERLAPKRLWIADGHHRYETALKFREAQGEHDGLIAEDFMMMAVTSMNDPGLVLLPTHRILKRMPVDAAELRRRMGAAFVLEDCPNSGLAGRIARVAAEGKKALGVALPGGTGFVAHLADPGQASGLTPGPGSDLLKSLDVSVLHGYVFERLLGLSGLDFFGYTRVEEEAVRAVEDGAPASFLMNPPTVDEMRRIALGGEKMPQKSTYYYPKLLSGLVLWSLRDF
jgi:uncharacterized protein (DUF1015 family)